MKKDEIIFGSHSVIEAIEAGKEIEQIFVKKNLRNELSNKMLQMAREKDILIKYVPIEKLNRITRKNHQGAIAFVSPIEYQNLEEILIRTYENGESPFFLVLDGITDTRNMGAIARTAECAGVHAIIVGKKNSAQISSDTVKTSAGALMHIPICRVDSLPKTVTYLRESGIKIFSANEKNNEDYAKVDYNHPCAVVMGAEDKGISRDLLDLSDKSITIPIIGKIQSLNVSVACGVILYEAVKQRSVED
jgi:23S rRNA (guanosine2251-2'-O)-methyltransferase